MKSRPARANDLTAYCATCPLPEEVTAVLQPLGFWLAFAMKADDDQEYLHLPPLPAQFHFEDAHGTQLIYLAGNDIDLDDMQPLPAHRSRFWLYAGTDPAELHGVIRILASTWSLTWQVITHLPRKNVA